MFAKIFALLALVAAALAAPSPKPAPAPAPAPAPQLLTYNGYGYSGYDVVSPYGAAPAVVSPYAAAAPLAYSAYPAGAFYYR